nr:KTSC domain-containing protein [Pedobacter panaciterrae]
MPSSVIRHFNYVQNSSTLYITFLSGTAYKYKNVPLGIYDALIVADSKGRYFNSHIKNKFKYQKIRK